MNNIRLKAFKASIPQFIIFSILSLIMIFLLFHAAILSAPISAFMWTFWGFNIFTMITGIKIKTKYIILFGIGNFLIIMVALIIFITSFEDSKNDLLGSISFFFILPLLGSYIILIIRVLKIYWMEIKNEIEKIGKRKDISKNN